LKNLEDDEKNVLYQEYRKSLKIYQKMVEMAEKGFIKQGHTLSDK
jgi:hypothetical protein